MGLQNPMSFKKIRPLLMGLKNSLKKSNKFKRIRPYEYQYILKMFKKNELSAE